MRLIHPKILQFKNGLLTARRDACVKVFLLVVFGSFFWVGIFAVFYRILFYFRGIEIFGEFLALKLLSMVLLTFFSILIFSTIITTISTLFMSEELQLVIASPYNIEELYWTKLFETIVSSSWMVLLFGLPVFISYGIIFKASVVFYGALIGGLVPFVIISGAIGAGIGMSLVSLFPARRLKDALVLLTLIIVIVLYGLFRFIKPERLVDPDAFFTVVDYLTALEAPASPFLPSQWLTDVLTFYLFQREESGLFFHAGLLWSSAAALAILVGWFFSRIYAESWSKSQEANATKLTRQGFFYRLLDAILPLFPLKVQATLEKDVKSFFRDTAQWSQLFVLLAIIVIYLYNFSVLPLDKSPIPTWQLQNIIAFLNLGLAGFVIAAVAVRFAYPAVSLEGESFWIIRSSPAGLSGMLWCKFWVNFIFLFSIAVVLIICSNVLLRVGAFMMALSTATVFLMTFGLTSLGVGMGAINPRFRHENVAQIATGFGGLSYMITAVLFVGAIVVLEAWPVHTIVMAQLSGKALDDKQLIAISLSFAAVGALAVAAFFIPMRLGRRALERREII